MNLLDQVLDGYYKFGAMNLLLLIGSETYELMDQARMTHGLRDMNPCSLVSVFVVHKLRRGTSNWSEVFNLLIFVVDISESCNVIITRIRWLLV